MTAIKQTLVSLALLLLGSLLLAGDASAQRLSSVCVFTYDNKPYQWSRMRDDVWFTYINDSGQAVGENFSQDYPRIYFYDSDSFSGRQIATFTDYTSEYSSYIQMWAVNLNNDGVVFGNIALVNPSPDPEINFRNYSNGFAFKWDQDEGFVDLAGVVNGITGRGDTGYFSTVQFLGGNHIIVDEPPPPGATSGGQYTVPFPFPVREKQNHIPLAMMTAIEDQCGSTPVDSADDIGDSNANLEFISGKDIVRTPHANFGINVSHWWYSTEIYYGSEGQLGDDLNFRLSIDNYGALDIYSLTHSLEVVNHQTAEILELQSYSDAGPRSVDAGEFSDYFHFYTRTLKPGTYAVRVVTRGLDELNKSFERYSSSRILTVESSEPLLNAKLAFTDGRQRQVVGELETFGITLEVSTTAGNNPIDNINFTNLFAGAPNLNVVSAPEIPPTGFSLQPGSTRKLNWTLMPNSGGNFRLATSVSGTNVLGLAVTAADDLSGSIVAEDLTVEITLNPDEEMTQDEKIGSDPEPIDLTVDVKVCNNTSGTLTNVTLNSVGLRSRHGLPIYIDKISGPVPTTTELMLGDLTKKACKSIDQSVFRVNDDGEIEVDALATATSPVGARLTDTDEKYLRINPKFLFEVTPEVVNPVGNAILEAGVPIRIQGKLKNLSNLHELDTGPLYAVLRGNAGAQSFAWNGSGTAPDAFVIPQYPMIIEPGGERDFSIRVATAASDPRHNGSGEGKPSGGTRAYIELVPWAVGKDPDGELTEVFSETTDTYTMPDMLKNSEDELKLQVSLDDRIAIPVANNAAIAAGVTLGAMQGTYDMGVELLKAPYTLLNGFASMLNATIEFQDRIWESFTDTEKELFAEETSYMILSVLLRHYEFAKEVDTQQLWNQINATVLEQMTTMAEEWELGDYTSVATTYSRFSSSIVGEVAFPVALWKLGKYQKAQQVLRRGQDARNARNRALLTSANVGDDYIDLRKVERILLTGEPGVEATVDMITKLFGYTPEEIGRLQAALDRYPGLMMTTRSKNARSIFWKTVFDAVLKPEALKAKGVSWMDEVLGYPKIYDGYSPVGAMIFKKPHFMVNADFSGRTWGEEILSFLASKNIQPGDAMYDQAVERLLLRAEEWVKYEKIYKKADRKSLDLTFDTDFNSVSDETAALIRRGSSNETPLGAPNHVGFRLRAIHEAGSPYETYVMEMRDKRGIYRPITGDVDNTGFTRSDGTALDELLHAKVLDDFYGQGLIEHGDSATAKPGIGGLGFIEKQAAGTGGAQELVLQWKAGEAGPRLVRFNREASEWNGPRDFRLLYDGMFVDVPHSPSPQGPRPRIQIPNGPRQSLPAPNGVAKSISAPNYDGSPNAGRCQLFYSDDAAAESVIMDSDGLLANVGPDGTITQSELHDICFSDDNGGVVSFEIAPSSMLSQSTASGSSVLKVVNNGSAAATSNASTMDGFEPGQTIVIGADTDHAEIRQIVGIGSLELDRPLQFDHDQAEVVVVVAQRDSTPPPITEDSLAGLDTLFDSVAGSDGALAYAGSRLHYASAGIDFTITVESASPTADGVPIGAELTDDAQLLIHTETGQTISGHGGLIDSDLFELQLGSLDLVHNDNAMGHIVAGAPMNTGPLFFAMLPAVTSEPVASDTPDGLTFVPSTEVENLMLVALVSRKNGEPRRQLLYPSPVDWLSLKSAFMEVPGVTRTAIDLNGVITITVEGEIHRGVMDYLVQRGVGDTGATAIEIGEDVNGDGLPDIQVTYPDGNRQTMYYLGL